MELEHPVINKIQKRALIYTQIASSQLAISEVIPMPF
jgi:hypothetical protein